MILRYTKTLSDTTEPNAPDEASLALERRDAAPAIDCVEALDRLGSDLDFFKKLLDLFLQSEADGFERIRNALASADTELSHRLAHTLKSTAATVGAFRLEKAAQAIEQAILAAGRADEALLTELEAAHAEALAEIRWIQSAEENLFGRLIAVRHEGETP